MSNKSFAQYLNTSNPILSLLEGLTAITHLKQTHARLLTSGLPQNYPTTSKLLHLCSRAAESDAIYSRLLFGQIRAPNSFAWNCLLRSQSKSRNPNGILSLYKEMLRGGAIPNGVAFSFVLKACADVKKTSLLMGIHAHCLSLGFQSDVLVSNSLVHGYVACGSVDSARVLFDDISERDLVSWTEVIYGYVRGGRAKEALDLFFLMMESEVRPDEVTVVAASMACSQLGDLNLGRKLESLVRKAGVRYNSFVVNSLIDMYGKCGSIENAWELFERMADKNVVSWNSMVGAYANSGDVGAAKRLFDQISKKNEVSWSLMINGYVKNDCFKEALTVYHEMRRSGWAPNDAALTGAITACAHFGALDLGREIHLSMNENKVHSDVVLSTALVDMYAKCGCLEIACSLFDRIESKNLATWNVMIMGLAIHGKASECLKLFSHLLKDDGLRPSSVTFTGILSACAHAGWLEEGKDYFRQMIEVYRISPRPEHCSCMVHLLGQGGLMAEACEFIRASPVEPDEATWGALLSACKVHGYIELGKLVAKRILELNPCHTGAYLQLSTMFAAAGMWNQVLEIRKILKERGVKICPGFSFLEMGGTMHEFSVEITSDSQFKDMHSVLYEIDLQMTLTHDDGY